MRFSTLEVAVRKMPRFNFSSYISKNSLNDVTSLNDINPQKEWEQRQMNESTVQYPEDSYNVHSVTSSEIDRHLVNEINDMTGGNYTLEDLGLLQISSQISETETTESAQNRKDGFLNIEKIQDDQSVMSDRISEVNQSSNQYTEQPNTSTPKGKEAAKKKKLSKKEATKSKKTKDKSRASSPAQGSPRSKSPVPNNTDSPRQQRPASPVPKQPESPRQQRPISSVPRQQESPRQQRPVSPVPEQIENPKQQTPASLAPEIKCQPSPKAEKMTMSTQVTFTPRVHPESPNAQRKGLPTSLLFLDDENYIHPVKNTGEINNLVPVSRPEPTPPVKVDIEDSLSRLRTIPIEQVAHFTHLGDYVRHLQANERICDVIVHIASKTYSAHRVCLACYSDYFADIFYSRNDAQRVPVSVRLKGIKPRAFEILLKFIYTGVLDISPEVVADLMTMAESLRIPMVKTRVIDFLECLPLAKALSILMKEKIFGPMYDRAMLAVCEQFNTFRHEYVFLEIEIEPLVLLLSSDNLNIVTEMDVFQAAVKWISHNLTERKQYTLRLMRCVRFPYMTLQELYQCNEITDLMKQNITCKQMLLEAIWIATGRMLCKEDQFNLYSPKPRTCISASPAPKQDEDSFYITNRTKIIAAAETPKQEYIPDKPEDIIVFGGFNPYSSRAATSAKSMERYFTELNEWRHFGDLIEPRLHFAVCKLGGKLFLTGGIDPRYKVKHPVPTTDTFVFDIKRNAWIKVMALNTARMYHSMCSLLGMVYAIGGQNADNSVTNSVECYNPGSDKWFYVKPMSEPRLGTAVSTLDDKLVVAGGYGATISSNSGMPVLDSVESFDPGTNQWTILNKLRFPRCHGSLVTVNEKLYLCGGATRSYTNMDSVISSTSEIDLYNSQEDTWEHWAQMVVPRHDAGVAVVGDLIYVVGGASTKTNRILRSVECIDTSTGSWISGVQDLPYPSKWIQCLSAAV